MNLSLTELRQRGAFGALDVRFAEALSRMGGEQDALVVLALALVSRQTRTGHVCVDLARFGGETIRSMDGEPLAGLRFPDLSSWLRALRESPLTRDAVGASPLVVEGEGRLYLRRYWEHERTLAASLRARARQRVAPTKSAEQREVLDRLFGREPGTFAPQRLAAQIATLGRVLVLSGGPGTGKTTTVVRLVACLILERRAAGEKRPRTLLLAPTGKAAARLAESVERARARLDVEAAALELIPDSASTIHRALGSMGRWGVRFKHDADNPLLADIVVVDEASMVDVALMRRLVEAVRLDAHLIIVGDSDQLASVEAGAVLADLCKDGETPSYSQDLASRVATAYDDALPKDVVTPGGPRWSDHVVRLTKSYRFGETSAIGRLAAAVRSGNAGDALDVLRADSGGVRVVSAPPGRRLGSDLAHLVRRGFGPTLESDSAAQALERLDHFRVLCAHRSGPDGVESANPFVERVLEEAGLLRTNAVFYAGRPILVTENDYPLGLFNGDVGIVWREDGTTAPRAWFQTAEGVLRGIATSRLPRHETAFAMSIHKSQGSEFDEVAVVLPDASSPLLSRELLYTAVSRARQTVTVLSDEATITAALQREVSRDSGLSEALG